MWVDCEMNELLVYETCFSNISNELLIYSKQLRS